MTVVQAQLPASAELFPTAEEARTILLREGEQRRKRP